MNNPAGTLFAVGDLTRARAPLEQVLYACQRVLGPSTPTRCVP
jgi:hypothetical protein